MRKIQVLFDYLLVGDKITIKEERLMGFPYTPKQVEKLVNEAILELYQLEHQARIGRAVMKAFEQGYSVMRDDGDFEETFDNDMAYFYDLKTIANNEQDLLEWAEGVK